MSRPILTAVAWPYANGPRHIGHVSGFGVPSDVFSRYQRMVGDDVLMVSGTDEHGTPIQVQADNEGVTARELADRYNRVIVEDLQGLGLSYDLFTRTTTRNHYAVVQELFTTLHHNGYIVPKTTLGAISPSTGRTLPDRYIEGTCPICGYDGARGDQCDNCGNQLDPVDLNNPRCRINGETPEFVETEHFFLDLPAFSEALGTWLQTRAGLAAQRPEVQPEPARRPPAARHHPRPGLGRAGAAGRLGGPPGQADLRLVRRGHRLPVGVDRVGPPHRRPGRLAPWWQDPDAGAYYFMGKDNIVFHSVIWPAILLGYNGKGANGGTPGALGELDLPTEVVSSEFLTMEGRKFSSSRSVVIYVRDFLARYDADALRYYIAAAGPETQDTDFTWSEFVRRNNDELVAGWGNLVNRSVSMAAKNVGAHPGAGHADRADHALLATVARRLRHGRRAARPLAAEGGHRRGDAGGGRGEQVPLRPGAVEAQSDDPARMGTVLHVALQAVHDCNTMLAPVPAALGAEGARAAGRRGGRGPEPRDPRGRGPDGGPDYPVITGDYTKQARWGRTADRPGHRRWTRRPRCSPSSTRRWSRRSWPGSRPRREPTRRARAAGRPGLRQPLPPRHRRRGRDGGPGGSRSPRPWRGRARPASPASSDRLRPAERPLVGRGGRDARRASSPGWRCTPTRPRGSPPRARDVLGPLRRDRRSWRLCRGCARSARPGSTTTGRQRRASPRSRSRSAGTSTWPSSRQGAGDPRPGCPRRRRARPRLRGRPGEGGVPLLLRRPRDGAHLRRPRWYVCFAGTVTFKNAASCGPRWPWRRWTCCWWRPTRRSSPPCRTGASPTPPI